MENYEKKYKDALERAKEIIAKEGSFVRVTPVLIESIFPELKEREDERIRKAIYIYLDWLEGRKDYAPKGEYSIRDMLAWLEKQGEQKPADKIEPKDYNTFDISFGAKDSELQEVTYNIPKGFHAEIDKNKIIIKRIEVC